MEHTYVEDGEKIIFFGSSPDADRRCRCDFPDCKNRAYYECLYSSENLIKEIRKGTFKTKPLDKNFLECKM